MSRAGSPRRVETLSGAEARRIAVASQGLGARDRFRDPGEVLAHLGAIQLDAIQRVTKAHRLTCLARLPGASMSIVDDAFWGTGPARAFESAAHAVCLLPAADWPLWEFRRARTLDAPWRPDRAATERVLAIVRDTGPVTLSQIEGDDRSSGWDWSPSKQATEYLVWTGQLICCERRGAKRVYDLAERRLPAGLLGRQVGYDESIRQLVERAAAALGVATAADLAEYFRLPPADIAHGIPRSRLVPVRVAGWDEPAWAWPAALDTASTGAPPTLIGPFDNLIWDRDRTRRLFDFDYAFEAYKPAGKRQYGYYVLPLLVDDALVGRVDLARNGTDLEVLAAYPQSPAFDGNIDLAVAQLAEQLSGTVGGALGGAVGTATGAATSTVTGAAKRQSQPSRAAARSNRAARR